MFDLRVDPEALIEPTDVSYGWIFMNLMGQDERWDRLCKKHPLTGVQVEVISGAGFLSYVLRVRIFFDHIRHSFNVILKVPTTERLSELGIDTNHLEFAQTLIKFHNQEINFYKRFASHYHELYFPKMYAYVESDPTQKIHGRILMEDVGSKGMLADVIEGLDLAKCEEVMRALAKFHAFTYCHLNSELILQLLDMQESEGSDRNELCPALFDLNQFFVENKDTLQKMAKQFAFGAKNVHFKFGIPPFLAHGDFWSNNMFFEKKEDGSCGDKLFTIFDWQLPKIGTGMGDIARFLTTSATADVLRHHIDHLLILYHHTLDVALKKRGRAMPYGLEKIKDMFRFEFPAEYLFAAMILPTIAARSKKQEDKDNITERLKLGYNFAVECMEELQ